ncbi:MAG: SDR family oxidoreductase [Inquilinaceae bacterium]
MPMALDPTDRPPNPVVAITGGTAGVGRAVAEAYARQGWGVAVLARGADGLRATADEIARLGGTPLAIEADVADADAIGRAARHIEDTLGPISVWVNNAMITAFSPFVDVAPAEFERITQVVYLGVVNGTRAALTAMRPRDRGAIVNVGSGLAYRSVPLQTAYCGAKFAIRGFTDALRSELIHDRSAITLSVILLPAINTPQFDWGLNRLPRKPQPAPPIYQPEVAAKAVMRAARDGTREMVVGGSVLKLLVGTAVAPGWLDRKMADTAYDAQQSDQPEPGDRPNNVFTPLAGDAGAHGRFDDRAADDGLIVSARRLRVATMAAATLAGVILFVAGWIVGGA